MSTEDLIEILKAHLEGKRLQLRVSGGEWLDVSNPPYLERTYRIHPEDQDET